MEQEIIEYSLNFRAAREVKDAAGRDTRANTPDWQLTARRSFARRETNTSKDSAD
jgi:hypothetical protein